MRAHATGENSSLSPPLVYFINWDSTLALVYIYGERERERKARIRRSDASRAIQPVISYPFNEYQIFAPRKLMGRGGGKESP